ncbi:TetR/AcrR family transcriptional regulator [Bifidobacterium sp. ESL0682]|uniref:TetR/AcrR family transcriptional regulator n=1 Tax=Bifidobacterium sp. ESL0682 TaxID=2983212 RepID=UPI0023F83E06|nr:TetR/AcrR family transcriptional regulator [Bifidobacterium sp. ESL0682]WEV41338.1 TetR/AcrR family transcriptional regulator [Bifidobacterium sp. ESL0682]
MEDGIPNSERMIVDALFSKLETESFDSLTVTEIAAEANVSRKTFYRHFTGKNDVIRFYLEKLMSGLVDEDELMVAVPFTRFIVHYFEYFMANASRLRLLKRNNLLALAAPIQNQVFSERFPRLHLPWHDPDLGDEQLVDLFMIGGLWNVLIDNLDSQPFVDSGRLATELMHQAAKRTKYLK